MGLGGLLNSRGQIHMSRICRITSGTDTEFFVPDHESQAAIMAKFRAFMLNPDLFRTIYGTLVRIRTKSGIPDLIGPTEQEFFYWPCGNGLSLAATH